MCPRRRSSLDSETESRIMKCFIDLAAGRTAVVVAHRLSTIKNCDVIYVMRNGKVVEQGNHEELMKNRQGTYVSMYRHQQAEEALSVMETRIEGKADARSSSSEAQSESDADVSASAAAAGASANGHVELNSLN